MNIKLKKLVVSLLAMVTLVACGPKGSTEMVKETTEIEFATKEELTDTLYEGVKTVKIEGVKGSKETTYRVVYDGKGKEVSKDFESEVIVLEPVDEVVLVGTKKLEGKTLETKEITESEVIKFASKEEKDSSILLGETKVKQEGKDGLKEIVYTITLLDGVEQGREKKSEKVVSEAVDKIVLVGTKVDAATTYTKEVKENETIKFAKKEVKTDSLYVGQKNLSVKGVNGTREKTYSVKVVNGKEQSKTLVSEKVIKAAVDEITQIGTKAITNNDPNLRYVPTTKDTKENLAVVEIKTADLEVGKTKDVPGRPKVTRETVTKIYHGNVLLKEEVKKEVIDNGVAPQRLVGTKKPVVAVPKPNKNEGIKLYNLISQYRQQKGLDAIPWSDALYNEVSYRRAIDTLVNLSHNPPNGGKIGDYAITVSFGNELLSITTSAEKALANFKKSTAHNNIMLISNMFDFMSVSYQYNPTVTGELNDGSSYGTYVVTFGFVK